MRRTFLAVLLVGASSVWAATPAPTTVDVQVKNAKGEDLGKVTLSSLANGVRVRFDLKKLPPGEKAFHFHEKGSCVGPKFESAGAHFAPTKNAHGFDSTGGPHAGDMPNIVVAADGTAKAEFVNPHVSLAAGDNSLLRGEGTALVIHAKPDDYKTQPSGDAGDRVACGEIKAKR